MVAAPVKVVFNYFLSVALGQMSGVRAFLPTFVVSILAIIMPDWVDLAHNMRWVKGSGGLLVVSFLTSVAIGMALELGQLLLNHVCCKCCPCHDDEAITDAPAGQRADVVVAQPAA